MSTYTDLKNRIKESIAVGYDDRVTLQQVKFKNKHNEYEGSFSGTVDVDDITAKRGVMSNISAYDAYLKNPTIVGEDGVPVNLGGMADELNQLSTDLSEVSSILAGRLVDTNDKLSAVSSVVSSSNAEFESFKSSVETSALQLDEGIKQEVLNRTQSVEKLSTDSYGWISAESELRKSETKALSDAYVLETSERKTADSVLSSQLTAYSEDAKHYHISPSDSEVTMPFKAREFCINVVKDYDIPDAFVKDQSSGVAIGRIEAFDPATGDCEFVPFSDVNMTYRAIIGTGMYKFDNGRTIRDTEDPVYKLKYSRSGTAGRYSALDQNFTLEPAESGVRKLFADGKLVGIVEGAAEEPIISGYIRITAGSDSPLSVLTDGQRHRFDSNEPVYFNDGRHSVTYQSTTQSFVCQLNLCTWQYKALSDDVNGQWGKVYLDKQTDTSFDVTFSPYGKAIDITLSDTDGYSASLEQYEDGSFDRLKYVVSAGQMLFQKIKIRHEYSVTANTDPNLTACLYVSKFNRQITHDDIGSVVVDFSNTFTTLQEYWENPITLEPKLDGSFAASFETTNSAGQTKQVTVKLVSRRSLEVNVTDVESGETDLDGKWTVGTESKNDMSETLMSSQFGFPLNADGSDTIPDEIVSAYASGRDSEQKQEYILECVPELAVNGCVFGLNDIVISIPDKPEQSSISREFLFVVKPNGVSGTNANIKFVDTFGRDIRWFLDKAPSFIIKTNTFITFKLQEVRDDKFMVVDWNLNKQQADINRIDSEISELGQKIASNASDIAVISADLSAVIKRDRKDITFMGDIDSNIETTLSGFFRSQSKFGWRGDYIVKPSWMYHVNGSSNQLVDSTGATGFFGDNDYFMFKQEIRVDQAKFSDLYFIRDAQSEAEELERRTKAWTCANFAALSGNNHIEGDNLFDNADVNNLSVYGGRIENLGANSTTTGTLTVNSTAKFAQLSVNADKVHLTDIDSTLKSEHETLVQTKSNAEYVKTAVDNLSARYDNTFVANGHSECDNVKADCLKLVDVKSYNGEDMHREYKMVLSAGTIVLERIN